MRTSSPEHRLAIVSQEDWPTTVERFHALIQPMHSHLVVTTQPCGTSDGLNRCDFTALKHQLGQSYDAVLIDLSHGLHLNALAIVIGTIKGGGALVLHLGSNWLAQPDQELARYLPWPLTSANQTSVYKQLFYNAIQESTVFSSHWPATLTPYSPVGTALNADQQQFVQQVLTRPPSVHTLMAARGRGKSYALAELLYHAQRQGQRILCSATSPRNMTTLSERFQQLSGENVPFMAPDALLQQAVTVDLLVVDEAASLPLPLLHQLARQGKRIVFSSTDYGYEGSGRGFGIALIDQLKAQRHTVHQHALSTPIRWGENDPLEHWLDQLLFAPYQANDSSETYPTSLKGQRWLRYPALLDQAFSLLVTAHYQTSPDNKRWLVDDPSVTCFFLYDQQRVIGVALVVEEGPLSKTLAQQVLHGERRPRGHLLPQSLLAHEGIETAGDYRYWRISRIAIAPDKQQQGFGSQLLRQISEAADACNVDFLATSFAATPNVIQFWGKNHFQAVRLGSAKDQASGAYSLMMLKPLQPSTTRQAQQWAERFSQRWLQTLPLGLQALGIPEMIAISRVCRMGDIPHIADLAPDVVSDLVLFGQHHRPFSSIRMALLNLAMQQLARQTLQTNCPEDLILLGCGVNIIDESHAHELGYSGKKAFYQALKTCVLRHLQAL